MGLVLQEVVSVGLALLEGCPVVVVVGGVGRGEGGGGDDGGLLAENDEECDVGDDEVGAGDGVGLMVGGVHLLKSFLWLGLC